MVAGINSQCILGIPSTMRDEWLGRLDSNQDRQSQSLQCYRYTTPHCDTRTGLMGGR